MKSQTKTKTIDFIASFEGNGLMPSPVFMGKTNVNLFERMTILSVNPHFVVASF